MFVGSDGLALAPLTQRIAYLNDGDWTVVDRKGARFFGPDGDRGAARGEADAAHRFGDRQGQLPPLHGKGAARASGGDRRHAASHGQSRDARGRPARAAVRLCHAAAHHHQRLRQRVLCRPRRTLVVRGDRAHSRPMPMSPASSAIARRRWRRAGSGILVSQSGETADTMAALRYMREQGQHVLSIVNVPESSMARASRRRAGDGGGTGDQRRQHQGVHRAAFGAGMPGDRGRRARAARSRPARRPR